jgi:hypothetical protein
MSSTQNILAAFEGSKVAHGTTNVGRIGRNGKADADSRIVRESLTLQKIQDHLDGTRGVGAIPINKDNQCQWGALDIDVYDLDHPTLQQKIQKLKLPLVHCRSKSGGAHLFLFLTHYEQASIVREYLEEMAVAIGHSGCEIFPKQDKILSDRGDVGNFINLPYFNAKLTQRYCFNKKGEAMDLEEFVAFIEKSQVSIDKLEKSSVSGKRKYFTDGPPCLEHLFANGPTGEDRNKKLFMCGVYARYKTPDDWVAEFESMNRQLFTSPLDAKEVMNLQKSLDKKEYFYTCEQEPFKSYCDKQLCITRKFGVGDQGPEMLPIGSLTIMLSEPRLYFLDVAGSRVQLSTEQLQNQTLFQRACMEQILEMPPTMRPNKWNAKVSQLLKDATKLEVPEELKISGQFSELLQIYCTSRIRAMHPEELMHGKPWTDEGLTMFTMAGLMEFLNNRKFTNFTRAQVQEQLKRFNEDQDCSGHKSIRKESGERTTIRVWWVPVFKGDEVDLKTEEHLDEIPF